MSAPSLSAAIEALAITLHETTQMAYGLEHTSWHALSEVQRGDYRGDAIKYLDQQNPKRALNHLTVRNPDYFARFVALTRGHARVNSAIKGGE